MQLQRRHFDSSSHSATRSVSSVAAPLALLLTLASSGLASAEVLFEEYSAYHHIIVEDEDDQRALKFDEYTQSVMSISDPNTGGFDYTDFFHVPVLLNPTIGRVLFVGLGGGTGPKGFLRDYPKMEVDVVEIDPIVVRVAHQYFQLPKHPRLNVAVQDGRAYLNRSKDHYGAIIIDAYTSGPRGALLPYHLVTQEFFQVVRSHLEDGGVLVYNIVVGLGEARVLTLENFEATLLNTFETVYVFKMKQSVSTVFVAIKDENAAAAEAACEWPDAPWHQHPISSEQLKNLAKVPVREGRMHNTSFLEKYSEFTYRSKPRSGALTLTDNFAPVDIRGDRP